MFKLVATLGKARAGVLQIAHGLVNTPVFMPVGTQASVKAVDARDLREMGAEIILGNTYHLYLRPGEELVSKAGGLAEFSRWQGPTLTDSGGFQVSSLGLFRDPEQDLGNLRAPKITADGVWFWSHLDGSKHWLDAKKSIEIQAKLGSDIIMAFDEATPDKGREYAQEAMERTHRWLVKSVETWKEQKELREGVGELFGIIQGGEYEDLRRKSAEYVGTMNLPGIALGGGSVGASVESTRRDIARVWQYLDHDKPFYVMGVGVSPVDIVEAAQDGADMFDCVAPTRIARMGGLYHGKLEFDQGSQRFRFESEFSKARINIANRQYEKDLRVIQKDCDCATCRAGYSRAYLRHLFKARELSYYRLASIHNLRVMIRTMEEMREKIVQLGSREDGDVGKGRE